MKYYCIKQHDITDCGAACLAHVIVGGNLLHYVVIHKITKKQVIIADPGEGIVKLSPEKFFGELHEENNYYNRSIFASDYSACYCQVIVG